MSTQPQLTANHQNALQHGLTTAGDFIPAREREEFIAFTAAYEAILNPIGIAEESCALEVRSGAWRLRRCRALESTLPEDAENHATTLKSIERARSHAHNITQKAMAELRRLQTERQARGETKSKPEAAPPLTAPEPIAASFCKSPQPIDYVRPAPQQIPRGSLCPCQSGRKFKRCCGQNAPPTLHHGAKKVA